MPDIDKKIKQLIDEKAEVMNSDALYHCNLVSTIIKQLNAFINRKITLSEERITSLLDHLLMYYTITLEIPLDVGTKMLRAVKFNDLEKKPCFTDVGRLSYIPDDSGIVPSIGRLNKHNQAMYYGCLYFDDEFGGINVSFSEINALKNEKINLLKSTTNDEIQVNYIGIYNYIHREEKPYFLSEETYSYFKAVYEYEEKKFDKYLFTAFQLCDAFFSDILRREELGDSESSRLYSVTSILASLFLDGDRIDGLIYTSVKAEGSPVIALKPSSIDDKICHKEAFSFEIQEDYGYAIYKAKQLYKGIINGQKIGWE